MRKIISLIIALLLVFVSALPCFASTLVYSELSYIPSNSSSFNCYGYAIGTNKNIDPGYYCGSSLGSSASAIKQLVIRDLTALGYTNVRSVSSTYSLKSGERMIAFVYGFWFQTANLSTSNFSDVVSPQGEGYAYHFWKKDTNNGYWYHKFGQNSAIMRLKSGYTPGNITITDEYYSNSGIVSGAAHTVNATVYYIAFETNTSVNSLGD